MKTAALGIENLCVPCRAFCRYCLLSSCGKTPGVDYERGKKFARRLWEEAAVKRSDLRVFHYIGYCMDTPDLADYIRFSREIGSPAGKFLQFNGLALRDERETEELIRMVREEGVESIDLTFYGTREYHDRFAGRPGDFDFLLRVLSAANRAGLRCDVSLPLIRENLAQGEGLLDILAGYEVGNVFAFLPHGKGRGRLLEEQRLTRAEFDSMSDRLRARFSRVPYLTEGEWIRRGEWPEAERRTLTLCLTPDNIDRLESMDLEEILLYLERLDDEFYTKIPSDGALAERYGDKTGERMFRLRDLRLKWQQLYLADHPGIFDMNDEGHHFSVRA